jgi:tetratricopeptide (TPR) repeat protein
VDRARRALRPIPERGRALTGWDRVRDPRLLRAGLIALAAIALLGAAAGGGWAWYRAAETRSRQAFADASLLVQKAQEPGATAADREVALQSLERFIAEHGRSSAAPLAAYRLGNLRYDAGQYAASRGAYGVALAQGASGTLRTLAGLSIAYTWEAERDYAKAEAAYQAALGALTPRDFLYEELLTDVARVQESGGNTAGALATYRRLLKDAPDGRRADDIRARIASLESQPRR